jgi:phosphoglycerol transferase MdoB-like AlkP superfamily enzyme
VTESLESDPDPELIAPPENPGPDPAAALESVPALTSEPGAVPTFLGSYSRPLLILAINLVVFTIARVALLIVNHSDFSTLPAGQVAWSFVRGVHFDASIIFMILGLPLLLMILPFDWARGRLWQGIWGWFCFAVLMVFILGLAGDVIYFGYVHRHVGPEVTYVREIVDQVAFSALKDYLWPVLGFLAAGAGFAWLWRRLLRHRPAPMTHRRWRFAVLLLAVPVLFYAQRGTVHGKRLKIIDAFADSSPPAAYLALNGPFSAFHSMDNSKPLKVNFYPLPEAIRATQELLFAPGEVAADAEYPLLRGRPGRAGPKLNVVVIMVESWDAWYLDVIRKDLGLPPLGISPCFDALSREGVLYPRFYANGQKSMDGMSSILCGFPKLPRSPYIGRGLEQSRLSYLGQSGLKEGYGTLFVQGSKRDSFRCDTIAAVGGFQIYRGAEDIPRVSECAGPGLVDSHIPWDHDMFFEASRLFVASPKPFAGFIFTASTHPPYAWYQDRFQKFPASPQQNRYMNSIYYFDWALGQFFEAARKAGYYENTIFVVTADHISGGAGVRMDDLSTLHHVPCLIIAPGLAPGIDRRIGSQVDLLPTIIELAGWGQPHATLGRSLLDSSAGADRGAMCVQGDVVVRVEADGWVAHNLERRVAGQAAGGEARLQAMERRLLSVVEAAATLHRQNRLVPR